jgi:hypothetical protein
LCAGKGYFSAKGEEQGGAWNAQVEGLAQLTPFDPPTGGLGNGQLFAPVLSVS